MIILLALLPIPEHYLCGILCIVAAYTVKPRHVFAVLLGALIAFLQWYSALTILSMLPLQVVAFVMCSDFVNRAGTLHNSD